MTHLYHVIKDPVHGTMQFNSAEDAWVKPFIDNENFQRLRHIKQLGLGDYIFPGAMHSRFNHSLGCCYVAGQIAQKIGIQASERQLVMIACLLHDIGHGPFSHTFEGLFPHKNIRHEDWTPYFLADFCQTKFFNQYNKLNPRYPLSEEKFENIANMIMHRQIAKPLLADIVSSQLDADRLDYLLRDSHFCGVRYGEFDFRWLIHCMAIIETESGDRLGITHKGIGVIEHYLMARRLMMRNIYHSQKKLALENFLIQLLILLSKDLSQLAIFKPILNEPLSEFLMAANEFNEHAQSKDAKTAFLEMNYQSYKALCDYDIFALIKKLTTLTAKHPAIQIANRLHHRIMPKIVRFDYADLAFVKAAFQEFKLKHQADFQDWQLDLIETPHQAYSGEDDPILVMNEHQIVKPISDFSFMLNAISDQFEHMAFISVDKTIAEDARVLAFIAAINRVPLTTV